jgi:hypothetical protein
LSGHTVLITITQFFCHTVGKALLEGYMMTLSLLITILFFVFTNKITYWILLVNIVLVLVNFFFLFSQLGYWYFCMPLLVYNIFILIVFSYELKLLTFIGDLPSMLEQDLSRLTLSMLC